MGNDDDFYLRVERSLLNIFNKEIWLSMSFLWQIKPFCMKIKLLNRVKENTFDP